MEREGALPGATQQPLAQRKTWKLTLREGWKGRAPRKSSAGIQDPLRLEGGEVQSWSGLWRAPRGRSWSTCSRCPPKGASRDVLLVHWCEAPWSSRPWGTVGWGECGL